MITVDEADAAPPFEQVRRQIAVLIRGGELGGGQRLPAIRQLAGDLRVAPGTIARAYQQLEAEGLIQTSRARGTTVAPDRSVPTVVTAGVQQLLAVIGSEPVSLEDLLAVVTVMWPTRTAPDPT